MDNSEICAVCGGVYGLHNHMNKACPKDINADRNHTEYRRTVFSSTPQPLIMEGQGKEVTAITEFINWMESYREAPAGTISEQDCIDKATELLAKEREQIINARLSVTGLNHASPTDDNNLKDAETYFTNTYTKQ